MRQRAEIIVTTGRTYEIHFSLNGRMWNCRCYSYFETVKGEVFCQKDGFELWICRFG